MSYAPFDSNSNFSLLGKVENFQSGDNGVDNRVAVNESILDYNVSAPSVQTSQTAADVSNVVEVPAAEVDEIGAALAEEDDDLTVEQPAVPDTPVIADTPVVNGEVQNGECGMMSSLKIAALLAGFYFMNQQSRQRLQ